MVVKVFISSNQSEFQEERKYLFDELRKDPYFSRNFELFVFEEDKASSPPSNEVFVSAVEESDIYIGLIGQYYGNIYEDGVSATEYEYNVYISKKYDDYFFVKKCDNRDDGSQAFLERIRPLNKYKNFTSLYWTTGKTVTSTANQVNPGELIEVDKDTTYYALYEQNLKAQILIVEFY